MINTHCKDCIFARYNDNNIQFSCTLERPEKLGVKEIKDSSFVLERFCNTYRPAEWVDDLPFDQKVTGAESAALQEVKPRIGFFIRLDTDSENGIDDLEKTLKSIKDIHGVAAYVVVITDKVEYNEDTWGLFISIFGEESKTKYSIVQLTEPPQKTVSIIDEAFGQAQNGWIMTATSGETIEPEILDKLNKIINIDMKQVVMIEPNDEFSGLVFQAYIFKFLNGNKIKLFKDETVDSRDFVEKVKDAEKRGGTKAVMTWEEFNAS